MRVVHISDSHTKHLNLSVPECDVVVFTGDLGTRTNVRELNEFLIWFERLPAIEKIWIAGNHDIVMDRRWYEGKDPVERLILAQQYQIAKELVASFNIKYLEEDEYVYEGVKFFGSPYSPSFHRSSWVFNADRGEEIQKKWARIPSDVDILLTHTPPHGILDVVPEEGRTEWHKEGHVGCEDLMAVIKKRLTKLKLHCFGHIHDNSGIIIKKITQNRSAIFSNGACVDNWYKPVITKPFIIDI